MAYIPYGPQMPNFQGFGTGEANYGSAPYAEAAQQARFRLGTRDRILAALSGLSAVPRGANFGTAFLAAAGGSARATWAAKQAAMNYAQRQMDQEQRDADRAALQADREARTQTYLKNSEAYNKHLQTLEKQAQANQGTKYGPLPWYLRPEWKDTPEGKAAAAKATHISQGKAPAGPKPPKPSPRRIPAGLHKTEADLIRETQWVPKTPQEAAAMPDFIQHLTDIMNGRAEADSPALRRAAQMRLNQIQNEGR